MRRTNILNMVKNILKNEYLTYFVGLFTILFIMEILNTPNNNLIILIRYILNYRIVVLIIVMFIIFVGIHNMPLSFLLLTNLFFLLNIKFKVETFANRIPDLIDKNTLISYKKNFSNSETERKLNKKEVKKEKKKSLGENTLSNENKIENTEEEPKKIIKYYDEKMNVKNTDRLDLDKKYDIKSELTKAKEEQEQEENKKHTLEEELVSKNYEIKKDLDVLEEENSSDSSESSDSSGSSESSESSDSEGLNEVSMDEAREHIMKKIRNKIKKKYIKKK